MQLPDLQLSEADIASIRRVVLLGMGTSFHAASIGRTYIERLAAIVDAKMRAVAALGNSVDSLRVAVLAALNIADELCTARQHHDQIANLAGTLQNSQHSTRSRASTLAHMLDEVLEDRKVG